MQANDIEAVGALSALMYGAAQSIGASIHTSLSYVHQHGGQEDLLLLRINETVGLSLLTIKSSASAPFTIMRGAAPRHWGNF
jgi:hypothetical protein